MLKNIINILILLLIIASCKTSRETNKDKISKSNIGKTEVISMPEPVLDSPYKLITLDQEKIEKIFPKPTTLEYYESAYNEIEKMLNGAIPLDFKRAVFVSENAYFNDSIKYSDFENAIQSLVSICKLNYEAIQLINYPYSDSINIRKNGSIFKLMNDKLLMTENGIERLFQYNFDDYTGSKDWSNQFVITLLTQQKGNCHSLPFLYKIIADELKAKTYLSFAPNHIYLKNESEKLGWYNTELTSGIFPTDAWVKASGYITLKSIQNGIYMDTLSDQQSVAICLYDLAKGYFSKTKKFDDGFVIKSCDLLLKYHPNNINAIILKAETLKKIYNQLSSSGNQKEAVKYYNEMQGLYVLGLKLGYREMPKEMYQEWLISVKTEQQKYENKEVNNTLRSK